MANLKVSAAENKLTKIQEKNTVVDFTVCPVNTAITVIGGKWKVIILYQLRGQTLRFGELKRIIPNITQKMLTQQLRELEKDRLVIRKVYAQVPPKVEYSPTELANKLTPVLDQLCKWGEVFNDTHTQNRQD
ncbi:MAG: DNA-binding HxlR family transcriptional regulator [Oceanospirillaceae bacterium]|jgi:DNA-binding HxlR family transcriptional regulator